MSFDLFPKRWPAQNPDRIQLYSLATPNGQKVSIGLELLQLPYEAHLIDIGNQDQFDPDYLRLSPNGKIPCLIDPKGPDGQPVVMMESVAILWYLAEKTGKLLPTDFAGKNQAMQWLLFQAAHIGPMFGQFGHFYKYARDKTTDSYALNRYLNEVKRLLAVLDKQLEGRPYLLGEALSLVDVAVYPWVQCLERFYQAAEPLQLASFTQVERWRQQLAQQPLVQKGEQVCAP